MCLDNKVCLDEVCLMSCVCVRINFSIVLPGQQRRVHTHTHTHTHIHTQVGFKGFRIDPARQKDTVPFTYQGKEYTLTHGE